MLAQRLNIGDEIRIIAPSRSGAILKGEQVEIAQKRLEDLGFKVSFGKNVFQHDEFFSSSIESRVEDLHDAFLDPNVKGILTVIGGYNSNQLLKYINYDIIKQNPKIFCGYSDITALHLSIYKKTGLVTYFGPHFSSFGVKHGFEYTLESFISAVTNDAPFGVEPSEEWSDDAWYLDQEDRTFHKQDGYTILQEGIGEGEILAGNLCTMNLLQGTDFMPSLKDKVLFIEDDEESHALTFDRDLQSLLHLPDGNQLKAVIIGRFQKNSHVTEEALKRIIDTKQELKGIPVITNVNFGHVHPFATIPNGAYCIVKAENNEMEIVVEQR